MRGLTRAAAVLPVVLIGAVACGSGSSGGSAKVQTQSGGGGTAAVVSTHSSPAGTYLTDSKGMTLYLWKADSGSSSNCSGPCAQVWAPLTTSGTPQASGGAQQSMLGTTSRSDGSTQVTYANHPLYYYTEDKKAGEMDGQGSNEFGNTWYVVAPSGSAITGSSKGSGSESSSSSSPSKSSYNRG
jgi:predicted lipoprotein with Yx(FWY)xxD motif